MCDPDFRQFIQISAQTPQEDGTEKPKRLYPAAPKLRPCTGQACGGCKAMTWQTTLDRMRPTDP